MGNMLSNHSKNCLGLLPSYFPFSSIIHVQELCLPDIVLFCKCITFSSLIFPKERINKHFFVKTFARVCTSMSAAGLQSTLGDAESGDYEVKQWPGFQALENAS